MRSSPNRASADSETGHHGWPKTQEGTTDWETVFEDPNTGFIPIIMQAPSPAALRKSTVFVIRAIYSEGDSQHEVEAFISEIEGMLPDEVPAEMLPRLTDAVASVLRDIKTGRIRHAEEQLQFDEPDDTPKPRVAAKKRPRKRWAMGQVLGAVLGVMVLIGGVGGGVYYYVFMEHPETMSDRTGRLIAQMQQAAAGSALKRHEFGWPLIVEHRAGLIGVTAVGLPVDACASAAWYFVNRGNVVINDRMPEKIAPSVLKRFCAENGKTAKLLWLSKDPSPPGSKSTAAKGAETN